MSTLGTSFGAAAGDYAAGRPDYPADAVAWALRGDSLDVVDVGAGTGKLTAELVRQGHRAIAVDPDADMLAVLGDAVPGVPRRIGTAESLPLPDSSADALVFGQSWHWVDVERASEEAGRVVRRGGAIGLLWNIRDERVPWVRSLGEVMHGSAAEGLLAGDGPRVGPPFGPLERTAFAWTLAMTESTLRAMVRSRSYYIAASPERRERIDAGVGEIIASLGSEDGRIDMPYVTHAFRAVRHDG